MKLAIVTAAAATALYLAAALAALASPGIRMSDAQTRHWQWVEEAQTYVPLPDARITVRNGSQKYYPASHLLTVPFSNLPGNRRLGWTLHKEEGLFLHELGHAYDYADMTPVRRVLFARIAGTTCAWRALHCDSVRWVTGPDAIVDVSPQEMFAEMYAACALGLTQRDYQNAGFNTYGWVPPAGTDEQLCNLIRG